MGPRANLFISMTMGLLGAENVVQSAQVSIKYFFTWNPGQFRAVLARIADRRECSQCKSFHSVANKARRVYYGAIFEIKKESKAKEETMTNLSGSFSWRPTSQSTI